MEGVDGVQRGTSQVPKLGRQQRVNDLSRVLFRHPSAAMKGTVKVIDSFVFHNLIPFALGVVRRSAANPTTRGQPKLVVIELEHLAGVFFFGGGWGGGSQEISS